MIDRFFPHANPAYFYHEDGPLKRPVQCLQTSTMAEVALKSLAVQVHFKRAMDRNDFNHRDWYPLSAYANPLNHVGITGWAQEEKEYPYQWECIQLLKAYDAAGEEEKQVIKSA